MDPKNSLEIRLLPDGMAFEPHGEDYKARVRNQILKVKQQKADTTWRMKKAGLESRDLGFGFRLLGIFLGNAFLEPLGLS